MTSDLSRFEEKIHCVDLIFSVMVKRRVVVERDESSGMVVSDCLERSEFILGIGEFVSGDFEVAEKIDSVEVFSEMRE